jgi:hypothetical protein
MFDATSQNAPDRGCMHRTPAVFLGPLFRFIAPLIWKNPGPSPARLLDSFRALASASFALR